MKKLRLFFKDIEKKQVLYDGITIEVIPFLNFSDEIALINRYIFDYFGKIEKAFVPASRYNYLEAESNLLVFIMQTKTNIDIEELPERVFADSNFKKAILSEIVNYEDFRKNLDFIVNEIKQQEILENSAGVVLSNLIQKITDITDKMADLSPEEIEKARLSGLELMDKLEKSAILKDDKKSE